jgi:hypothetical protein
VPEVKMKAQIGNEGMVNGGWKREEGRESMVNGGWLMGNGGCLIVDDKSYKSKVLCLLFLH